MAISTRNIEFSVERNTACGSQAASAASAPRLGRRARFIAPAVILFGIIALSGCGSDQGQAQSQTLEQVGAVNQASVLVAQTPLDGSTIPKYVDALPTLSASRVNGTATVTVDMREFQQRVLPASVYASQPAPFNAGTFLWGYKVNSASPSWPSATIEARRGSATSVIYSNSLRKSNGTAPVLQPYLSQDQTLHWADPLHTTANNHCTTNLPLATACTQPYAGPIPAVAHLHGAEVVSAYDGHPDTWFTPGNALRGPAFVTNTYNYANQQEATTLWFHDHALGMTRLNVYSGLAGFYLLRDSRDTGLATNPIGLPGGQFEQELLIADRQFDTHGQLLFPDGTPTNNPTGLNGGPPNPDVHPTWIPEFFGDVITVNGKSWPFMQVQPRRYRFRFVNGSNARFYQMELYREANGVPTTTHGPSIWQIGSDGGLLNTPTRLDNNNVPGVFLAPAERADVIIDFAGQAGKNFILANGRNCDTNPDHCGAFGPYPSGDPPDPNTTGQVMMFKVNLPAASSVDTTYNPASPQRALRATPIVDVRPATTHRTPDAMRQLILVEHEGEDAEGNETGPEDVFLNNSHWNGNRPGTTTPIPGSVATGFGLNSTENPRNGSTEVWEIANLTEDAHPIHIHLIQFQVINREAFGTPACPDTACARDAYRASWDALFPGGTFKGVTYAPGTFIPGFGPPRNYVTPNAAGALGGNPAFTNFLSGTRVGPEPAESGWKDTVKVKPFEITRVAIRWAPQGVAVGAVSAGQNTFPFDPTTGGPGYVWHCHILDHEDNEMMRPYLVRR